MVDFNRLIKKELEFAKAEFQLKLKTSISEEKLRHLGAQKLGKVIHEDKYYIRRGESLNESNELIRVRKEGGNDLIFTYKGPVANKKLRNRLIINKPISIEDEHRLKKDYKEIIGVNKARTMFIFDKVLLSLDHLEHLGDFVEFEVKSEKESHLIFSLIKKLGLDPKNATKLSYFELALMNLNPLHRIFTKIHEKTGKMVFGISSATITTLGVIVGLNSATTSKLAIVGGIVALAISDSFAESWGIYSSKKAERGVLASAAFKNAIIDFLSMGIFTLSFAAPFLFLPIIQAVYLCILWGIILLIFVSFQTAFIQEESISKEIAKNLLLVSFVIILTYFVGRGIALIAKEAIGV